MAAEDRAAAACIVIALLMEEDDERRTRGPYRDWINEKTRERSVSKYSQRVSGRRFARHRLRTSCAWTMWHFKVS